MGVTVALGLQAPTIITPLFQVGYLKRFKSVSIVRDVLAYNFIFGSVFCVALFSWYLVFDIDEMALALGFSAYAFLNLQVEIIRKILIF